MRKSYRVQAICERCPWFYKTVLTYPRTQECPKDKMHLKHLPGQAGVLPIPDDCVFLMEQLVVGQKGKDK